jgi:hypothetical protein
MNNSFLLQNLLDCFTQLTDNKGVSLRIGVYGFEGSEVQGSIHMPGLHLGYVFTRKT